MKEGMVFSTDKDGNIDAGGFLVKRPANAPISILPDGLAVPVGLYTIHRVNDMVSLPLEPSKEVVEPSISDYLFSQLNESKSSRRKRETKRQSRNQFKKKTRSKRNS